MFVSCQISNYISNMDDNCFDPTELAFLWKCRGKKDYRLKRSLSKGASMQYMLFEDGCNQKFMGKIVTSPNEGEYFHWQRLQHENLAPLVDIVHINEKLSVYLSRAVGRNIKSLIHENEFMTDSECFNRKKSYAQDILRALDYLHDKSLCILNLSEAIVYVCELSDKAVICDFGSVLSTKRATEERINLPALYKAPELQTETGFFSPVYVETWACGVLLLQMFTGHAVRCAFPGDETQQVLRAVKEFDYKTVKDANPGAQINFSVIEDLRSFLNLFLVKNQMHRVNVRHAAVSPFLCFSRKYRTRNQVSGPVSIAKKMQEYCSADGRTSSKNPGFETNSSVATENIQLNEVLKCRDEFKKVHATNKFVNLSFVPHEGSEYPAANRGAAKKRSNVHTIVDKGKSYLEDGQQIPQYSLSRRPLIGDSRESQTCYDENSCKLPASKISLGRRSLGIDTARQYDRGGTADSQESELAIRRSFAKETDGREQSEAWSSHTDNSTDSKVSPENTEENIESHLVKDLKELDLESHAKNVRGHSTRLDLKTEKLLTSGYKAQSFSERKRTKSEVLEVNREEVHSTEFNFCDGKHSQSDTCLIKSKNNDVNMPLSASECSVSYSKENSKLTCDALDSAKITEMSEDCSPDYKLFSCGSGDMQSSEIREPGSELSKMHAVFEHVHGVPENQMGEKRPRATQHSECDANFSADGDPGVRRDMSTAGKVIESENFGKCQTQMRVCRERTLHRRNSYKEAISGGLSDAPETETNAKTAETDIKVTKKKSLKVPSIHRSSKVMTGKTRPIDTGGVTDQKSEQNLPLLDGGDDTSAQCSESLAESNCANDDAKSAKEGTKIPKKRKKRIKCFCL